MWQFMWRFVPTIAILWYRSPCYHFYQHPVCNWFNFFVKKGNWEMVEHVNNQRISKYLLCPFLWIPTRIMKLSNKHSRITQADFFLLLARLLAIQLIPTVSGRLKLAVNYWHKFCSTYLNFRSTSYVIFFLIF